MLVILDEQAIINISNRTIEGVVGVDEFGTIIVSRSYFPDQNNVECYFVIALLMLHFPVFITIFDLRRITLAST